MGRAPPTHTSAMSKNCGELQDDICFLLLLPDLGELCCCSLETGSHCFRLFISLPRLFKFPNTGIRGMPGRSIDRSVCLSTQTHTQSPFFTNRGNSIAGHLILELTCCSCFFFLVGPNKISSNLNVSARQTVDQ